MELSRFTVVTDLGDGEVAVFNTHTKALITMPRAMLRALNAGREEAVPPEAAEDLTRMGILTDDRAAEFRRFLDWYYGTVQRTGKVGLWLYLASDCNLGCPYCYQGDDKPALRLSQPVVDRLVDFIVERQAPYADRSLHVVFYGGEPLLNKDVLDYCLDRFNERFAEMPRSYSMITNGTLIDGAGDLERWARKGLESLQITIDGPPEEHDARRFRLEDGSGTFHEVLESVRAASEITSVTVRVNYDRDNYERVYPLVDLLAAQGLARDSVALSFAAVFESRRSDYDRDRLLGGREELECLQGLLTHAETHGFRVTVGFPGPCTIRNFNGLVVYPNGDVYSCPGMAGMPDYRWGNVLTHVDSERQAEIVYEGIYPECETCALLPICSGGCEFEELEETGVATRHCEYGKLLKTARLYTRQRLRRQDRVKSEVGI